VGTITDNDSAGFTLGAVSGNTTEAGGTATFTVVLTSQPTADVTVTVASSDTTEGTVGPATLTFTSANWNTAQTVTVTGVDDTLDDGDIAYSVTLTAASGDANYSGLTGTRSLANTDNDAAPTLAIQRRQRQRSGRHGELHRDPVRGHRRHHQRRLRHQQRHRHLRQRLHRRERHAELRPGETTKTVTVSVSDDALVEASESFNVVLSNINDATSSAEAISDATGVGTITTTTARALRWVR